MLLGATFLLPLSVLVVITTAGLVPAHTSRIRRGASIAAPLAVLPALVLALTGPGATLELDWLLLGTTLRLDELTRPLTLLTALLYGAALAAVAWLRADDREPRDAVLSAFLLASYTGNSQVLLAADTVGFYLGFTLMSFSAAGLVIHRRTAAAHRATVIYLVMSVISETSLLAALLLTVHAGGSLLDDAPAAITASGHTGLILTLLLIGFGIKAGTILLHVWLPLAHPAAPPAASAVLSGAMVKAGLVGWLRFLPMGATESDPVTTAAWVLLALSLAGAFLAAPLGILQQDPKVVLAYSTISQMGFIGAVVAAAMLLPLSTTGPVVAAAVLYALHHGLAKGALFLGVPVVRNFRVGPVRTVVLIGMLWAGLAVVGAPLTSGAFAKYGAKYAVEGVTVLGVELADLLPLVATGSTLLLLRFAWLMWREQVAPPRSGVDGEIGAWLMVCLVGLAAPWWIGLTWFDVDLPGLTPGVIWDAVWPILLGALPALLVWQGATRGQLPDWFPRADGTLTPPGDLVVVEESLVRSAARGGSRSLAGAHDLSRRGGRVIAITVADLAEPARGWVDRWERRLRDWSRTGLATLLLLGLALLLLLAAGGWSA